MGKNRGKLTKTGQRKATVNRVHICIISCMPHMFILLLESSHCELIMQNKWMQL